MYSTSALIASKYNNFSKQLQCQNLKSKIGASGGRYRDADLKQYKENCGSTIADSLVLLNKQNPNDVQRTNNLVNVSTKNNSLMDQTCIANRRSAASAGRV